MNKNLQELELRNILQGLQEFATSMSYQNYSANLRIINVETSSANDEYLKEKQLSSESHCFQKSAFR